MWSCVTWELKDGRPSSTPIPHVERAVVPDLRQSRNGANSFDAFVPCFCFVRLIAFHERYNGRKWVRAWRGTAPPAILELSNFYAALAQLRVQGQKGVRICACAKCMFVWNELKIVLHFPTFIIAPTRPVRACAFLPWATTRHHCPKTDGEGAMMRKHRWLLSTLVYVKAVLQLRTTSLL